MANRRRQFDGRQFHGGFLCGQGKRDNLFRLPSPVCWHEAPVGITSHHRDWSRNGGDIMRRSSVKDPALFAVGGRYEPIAANFSSCAHFFKCNEATSVSDFTLTDAFG